MKLKKIRDKPDFTGIPYYKFKLYDPKINIMIDNSKSDISYISEKQLLENSSIDWHQKTNLGTGEMKYPIVGTYHNMSIIIKPQSKVLKGSLHQLYNILQGKGKQNYDSFDFHQIQWTIEHLKKFLSLDIKNTIIENLEIGLNIETNENPETILNKNLIAWDCREPTTNDDYNGKGKYLNFKKSDYIFKIYYKGKQYNTGTHIMRIECKIMRNEKLRKIGLSNLEDLTLTHNITALLEFLYQSFTNTLIIDNDPLKQIIDLKEKEIIKDGINPKYWISIKGMQKSRFKKKIDTIIEKYNLNQIYKDIKSKLRTKGKELLKCYDMNDFQNIQSNIQNSEMLRYEPYIYIHNLTQRKCKITGIDITHQKSESKFLSMSSIKRIYETEPETFKTLIGNFSPKEPETMDFDKLCLEIAHNIRNRESNRRREIERKTIIYKCSLFPLPEINISLHQNFIK